MHPWTKSNVPCLICFCSNLFLSSIHPNIGVVRDADDYDSEEAAAAHLPHKSSSNGTEMSFHVDIWEETAFGVRGKPGPTKKKEHKDTCKRCTRESVNQAWTQASVGQPIHKLLFKCNSAKTLSYFNFTDKYSPWKISRLYFLLSLYLFFWIACVPDGMKGTKKK